MKFFTRLFLSFNVFVFTNVGAFAVPVLRDSSTTNQKYFHSLNQQNLNAVLTSIEIKLQNLDQSCSLQSTTIQTKLAYYERKLDKMEKEILRIEMRIKTDLDKLSENISNKNFRDDITADRIIKKIDSAFDRVSNKYATIESNMDLIATKIQNTRDIVTEKIDKIDESLYIRDGENAAEMEDAIEDLKKVCISVEESLFNRTQDHIKNNLSNQTKLSTNDVSHYIQLINGNSSFGNDSFSNCSGIEIALDKNKADIEISINDFTNKVTDMKYSMDEALVDFKQSLQNVVLLVNETKKEQQNNYKELKNGRKNSNNKYGPDNDQLTEINNKIDKHFKRLIAAQNSFSENCYKLQMDESQIERKISFVLEQIIETFQNKTTLKPEDIHNLENGLFVHDTYIRRHIYELSKRINNLSKKMPDDRNNTIYTVKQIMHEENGMLEEKLQNLETTINNNFISNRTMSMVNANLKNILKALNITTSLNFEDLEHKFNGTNIKNSTDTTFTTSEDYYSTTDITEIFFNYASSEETNFPDVNFPIDVRFGIDDLINNNTNTDSDNYNVTEANMNSTFSVDMGPYGTQKLNFTESKITTNYSSDNDNVTDKLLLDWPTEYAQDTSFSNSQAELVDENTESYLNNRSDYDLEMVEPTLNNKDHAELSETDNEKQNQSEIQDILRDLFGEDST